MKTAAAAAALILLSKGAVLARDDALVFVVSPHPAVRSLPATEVRQIFAGRITRWKNGRRIVLATRPETTAAGRAFYDRFVNMSEIDYSQLWLGILFRGEAVSSPRVLASKDEIQAFLGRFPDGLSFLLATELSPGDSLRPLLVDGRGPRDPSYPFRLPPEGGNR